jgi:hypothetical protein
VQGTSAGTAKFPAADARHAAGTVQLSATGLPEGVPADVRYKRSTTIATPMPPPTHSDATPNRPPVRRR